MEETSGERRDAERLIKADPSPDNSHPSALSRFIPPCQLLSSFASVAPHLSGPVAADPSL